VVANPPATRSTVPAAFVTRPYVKARCQSPGPAFGVVSIRIIYAGAPQYRRMDDLWFVGLIVLLAALTWLGVKLFDRLMHLS
jgi:hypothetical protein